MDKRCREALELYPKNLNEILRLIFGICTSYGLYPSPSPSPSRSGTGTGTGTEEEPRIQLGHTSYNYVRP